MTRYEFKVIPAPRKGEKSRAARTTPDRFALALTMLMNELGQDGWDYVRADTLPCDERVGLTGSRTTFQHMLVFRRPLADEASQIATIRSVAPLMAEPVQPAVAPPVLWPAPDAAAPPLGPARSAAE